ncbi:MAG: ribonuclease III [Anaeroplasmataceae bacterium]
MKIEELEQKLGLKFNNKSILIEALTHSSYSNENNTPCNERLEFLGDAVLELSMSKYLHTHTKFDEGVMTKKRAQAVREEALVIYADHLDLNNYLLLGMGEIQTNGKYKSSIIADAFEAIMGAIFTEFGFDKAYDSFFKLVVPYLEEILSIKDYKSLFQELVQADKRSVKYEITNKIGPSHNTTFEAVVFMDSIIMGKGTGKTKKEAEQMAAKKALEKKASM